MDTEIVQGGSDEFKGNMNTLTERESCSGGLESDQLF